MGQCPSPWRYGNIHVLPATGDRSDTGSFYELTDANGRCLDSFGLFRLCSRRCCGCLPAHKSGQIYKSILPAHCIGTNFLDWASDPDGICRMAGLVSPCLGHAYRQGGGCGYPWRPLISSGIAGAYAIGYRNFSDCFAYQTEIN
ncbi:hypothetical protein SDC9_209377 [bioreactor metagenome]|uniref:Uncharacterized protein n=1 Tax=bioreactor metagenome TaxID=1076179 RepID=A0A645JG44_9ZZZZ